MKTKTEVQFPNIKQYDLSDGNDTTPLSAISIYLSIYQKH